jgi:prevent-host-death family protein
LRLLPARRTALEISVSDAKAQITDLVRRAEAGEEVVLTRFGKAVAKLVPIAPRTSAAARRAVLDAVRAEGRAAASLGPGAARSQDFLYDEEGLPR